MKKQKWSLYQIDSSSWIDVKTVAELSESQAKDALCECIDLIEEIDELSHKLAQKIQDWRDG